MSNIIRIGGGGGGSAVLITKTITQDGTYNASSDNADGYSSVTVNVAGGDTLGLHSGKIGQDGSIVADADYYYTDEFDCPQVEFMMDFGTTSNPSYTGIRMYTSGGSAYEYWNATTRYRSLDNTGYYQAGAKARLSFPVSHLADVILLDYTSGKVFANASPVKIQT